MGGGIFFGMSVRLIFFMVLPRERADVLLCFHKSSCSKRVEKVDMSFSPASLHYSR